MHNTEVRAFEEAHVGDAAHLLSLRHRLHRLEQPHLPSCYEEVAEVERHLAAVLQQPSVSGAVAMAGGEVTGFILGGPKTTDHWGPNVWVEAHGQAARDPEHVRDLYALAAQRWVDEGRLAHYVVVPAHDRPLLAAWFHLAFGLQHVHALRPSAGPPYVPAPAGVLIRQAEIADVAALVELDLVLPTHQARSPVFSSGAVPSRAEIEAEWRDGVDDPEYRTLVAEVDGVVVGVAVGASVEKSGTHTGLARPGRAAILGYAAVLEKARGNGVGRALGSATLAWADEEGYPVTVTDWRAANLLSSRTWPRLGFSETFLRLHRLVGY